MADLELNDPEELIRQEVEIVDSPMDKDMPMEINLEDFKRFTWPYCVNIAVLRHLKICGIRLTEVPASLGLLTNLLSLELRDNELKDLPKELGSLTVKNLSVSGQSFMSLPTCFYRGLGEVSHLNISRNGLRNITTPPLCAARLRSLDISCNRMQVLPYWLSTSCGSLSSLSAGHNISICGMSGHAMLPASLRRLIITNCRIGDLDFLGSTHNLENLRVGNLAICDTSRGNRFWDFPETILQSAASLLELSMRATGLQQFPEKIGRLHWLEKLDLRDCELITLPKEVGQLVSLQSLLLSNNSLFSLPDSVADLQSLRELRIDGNEINVLPDGVGRLTKLVVLDLYNNFLVEWDNDWFNSLSSLKALDVELNQFSMEASERYRKLRSCLRGMLGCGHRSEGTKPEEDVIYDDLHDPIRAHCFPTKPFDDDEPLEVPQFEERKPESDWGSDDEHIESNSDSEWTPPDYVDIVQYGEKKYYLWPPVINFSPMTPQGRQFEIHAGQFQDAEEV